jgi:hypothetical protein
MTLSAQPTEQDERVVEEAHCAECGAPITAIPSWYADVAVKFSCDNCRQKSPRLAAAVPAHEADAPRATGLLDADGEAEPALEDIDVDDIDVEDPELDPAEE